MMKLAVSAALLALAVAAPAFAQDDPPTEPVPPPPDCDSLGGDGGGGAAPPPDAAPEPFFGQVIVESPLNGMLVPRNVELRLAGDVSALDAEPAQFTIDVRTLDGARVGVTREGSVLRLVDVLPADETVFVRIAPTAAHPCPDCIGIFEMSMTTTDEIDVDPPVLDGTPPVNVFVMPSAEDAAKCGFFFGTTHTVHVVFGQNMPLSTWISVAARKEGSSPVPLFLAFNNGNAFPVQGNVGAQVPVALGDEFYVAFTARDLAGNVSAARTVRVRARSFTDQAKPVDELAPLWCEMPASPVVTAPETLPTNGQLAVDFPFEELPVALAPVGGGEAIPLVPVSETALGHVFATAAPLPAGASFDVVGLDCPHCVCEGCARFEPVRVTVGAEADVDAPGAPVIVGFLEDADPVPSVEEQCRPDRAALIVVLEPGTDDVTSPLDLRYDASIRLGDSPALVLAKAARPLLRADGTVLLRLETRGLGRVLGDRFELTLDGIDSAGHRATATATHDPDAEGAGCASADAKSAAPLWALALFTLLTRRSHRFHTARFASLGARLKTRGD